MERRLSEYAAAELRQLCWALTETEVASQAGSEAGPELCLICTERGGGGVGCEECGQVQCRRCLLRLARPHCRPACPFCRAAATEAAVLEALEVEGAWLDYQCQGYLAFQPPATRPLPLLRPFQARFLASLRRALRLGLPYLDADRSFRPHRHFSPVPSSEASALSLPYYPDTCASQLSGSDGAPSIWSLDSVYLAQSLRGLYFLRPRTGWYHSFDAEERTRAAREEASLQSVYAAASLNRLRSPPFTHRPRLFFRDPVPLSNSNHSLSTCTSYTTTYEYEYLGPFPLQQSASAPAFFNFRRRTTAQPSVDVTVYPGSFDSVFFDLPESIDSFTWR